jgi:hypothetical protein
MYDEEQEQNLLQISTCETFCICFKFMAHHWDILPRLPVNISAYPHTVISAVYNEPLYPSTPHIVCCHKFIFSKQCNKFYRN